MRSTTLREKTSDQNERDTELVQLSGPCSSVISVDPERIWGAPCIVGTRVPIKILFDQLAAGVSLEEFLYDLKECRAKRVSVRLSSPSSDRWRACPMPGKLGEGTV